MCYKEIREKPRIYLWEIAYQKERHKSDTKWSYKKEAGFIHNEYRAQSVRYLVFRENRVCSKCLAARYWNDVDKSSV